MSWRRLRGRDSTERPLQRGLPFFGLVSRGLPRIWSITIPTERVRRIFQRASLSGRLNWWRRGSYGRLVVIARNPTATTWSGAFQLGIRFLRNRWNGPQSAFRRSYSSCNASRVLAARGYLALNPTQSH